MFLEAKYIQARGTLVILKQTAICKLHLYSVFKLFQNTAFVFFAYLEEKLNTTDSFWVFILCY